MVAEAGASASRRLGRFTVEKLLYKGQQAVVFSAVGDSGERVAIKASHKLEHEDKELIDQIRREVTLTRELRSPYIIRGLETWEDAQFVYLAQEYASGGDLTAIVGYYPLKCVPEQLASQKILKPLLLALSFLHGRGIIHRDIKPENIVMTEGGAVKLCDFGFALDTRVNVPVNKVGTLEFMAPEIVRLPDGRPESELEELRRARKHLYGTPVDIWSLGCVAFELLFGSPLFSAGAGAHQPEGDGDAEVEALIACKEPVRFPELTRCRRRLSPAALELVAGMLARSDVMRPNADYLLTHPWIAGEPDPDALSTSPIPLSSSPLAAFASAFSMRRGAASMTSLHEAGESSGTAAAAPAGGSFRFRGRAGASHGGSMHFSEALLGDGGRGGMAVPCASDGDLLSSGTSFRRRNRAAELLVWPPGPSPTSTLHFPAEELLEAGCISRQPQQQREQPSSSSSAVAISVPRANTRSGAGSRPGNFADAEGRTSITCVGVKTPAERAAARGNGAPGSPTAATGAAAVDGSWRAGLASFFKTRGAAAPVPAPAQHQRRQVMSMPVRGGDLTDDDGSWNGGVLVSAGIALNDVALTASKKDSAAAQLPGANGETPAGASGLRRNSSAPRVLSGDLPGAPSSPKGGKNSFLGKFMGAFSKR